MRNVLVIKVLFARLYWINNRNINTARELALKEGLFLGYSCGSAIQGLRQLKSELKSDDVPVVLFHDHGSRYVAKIYNDDWMREQGFID